MRFKVDENLPAEVASFLRSAGYDALSVLDQFMGGVPDDQVYRVCQEEQRILVTLDLDFANVQVYPPSEGEGVVVLRLAWQDKITVMEAMQRLLPVMKEESPERRLWIVEEERIRIRE